MNLSTSNSRKTYLKLSLAVLGVMTISLGLVRLVTYVNKANGRTILGHVLEAQAALPQILEQPEDLVMVFGSSMVGAGFSPREFDAALAQEGVMVKSYNFGFGGLNPLFQDVLSRRIKEAFQRENRRLKLALVEFNPFQTTVTRRNGAIATEDSFFSLLASEKELFHTVLEDPERGLRWFTIRYLRDGISAEMITSLFSEGFREPLPKTKLVEDEAMVEKRGQIIEDINRLFDLEFPNFGSAQWSFERQGGSIIPSELSPELKALFYEYYDSIQTDFLMAGDRLRRIQRTDILDLHFEEDLVVAFIEIVKNFQAIADIVEVVLLPKNTDWIKNPPEALRRMQTVMDRIARETGVEIRNWQEIEPVKNHMFRDTTHLNRLQGAPAFTEFLVEHYVDRLK